MRRSGKYAYVDGVPCTAAWSSTQTSQDVRYNASCAPGGSVVAEGNKSETGNLKGYGYNALLPSDEDMAFVGVASAKLGELVNYIGDVLIYETSINIPVKAGGPISWQSNWGAQGLLTKETATQYLDDNRVPAASGKNGKISIEGTLASNTFTDVDGVQDINLIFRMPVTETVVDGEILREAGNLECDLNFQVENDDREVALYALDTFKRVRVYVTPSLFFLLDAVKWGEKSNYSVNREGAPMISYQVNGQWSALITRSPAALGQILLPGGSEYYGGEES